MDRGELPAVPDTGLAHALLAGPVIACVLLAGRRETPVELAAAPASPAAPAAAALTAPAGPAASAAASAAAV
ncbi:hypothetical protein SAMN05216371_2171 [Streptomyces sp. TLI_053]|uniref:hypothetical protein n=1 Tax=Streptomyces sp. TLI_053 TaxID=1855352 RepID=UPI0008796197|nr:hypothetical protein [Streptomyces sp. TLI_053]SDT40333.1 hypothetical protein SAMN05216371_2171 [Streptomyces sp. TLI_053]